MQAAQVKPWYEIETMHSALAAPPTLEALLETFCRIASGESNVARFELQRPDGICRFRYLPPPYIHNDIQMELYRVTGMIGPGIKSGEIMNSWMSSALSACAPNPSDGPDDEPPIGDRRRPDTNRSNGTGPSAGSNQAPTRSRFCARCWKVTSPSRICRSGWSRTSPA